MAAGLAAVELNDAAVVVAVTNADGTARQVGVESPGFAVPEANRVLVGTDAARKARVAPLHAQNRYWHALGLEPLPWTAPNVTTFADLAHAHLQSVIAPALEAGATELVLAVPPGYTREQLGLLVGIANECGATVAGLVDLGLAACAAVPPAPQVLHLDLQLHQAAATLLEASRGEGVLRRARYELLPGAGVLALRQAAAAAVAGAFVRETRFDPLHQAATEQRLHDQLPDWLAALTSRDEVPAEIEFGAVTNRVTLERRALAEAAAPIANELVRLVQSARPAGTALQLCITPRVVSVPGLVERLTALRDCVVVELPAGAAAFGALESASNVVRPAGSLALVHRLPLAPSAAALDGVTPTSFDAVPADLVPTHVLFRGRAWAIGEVPLTLGWSVPAQGTRALALPAGVAGVSRAHCTLRRREGLAVVEDHSTYGTFVNDERVGAPVALRVGDVLRLGAPGLSLELIRVVAEHAT